MIVGSEGSDVDIGFGIGGGRFADKDRIVVCSCLEAEYLQCKVVAMWVRAIRAAGVKPCF